MEEDQKKLIEELLFSQEKASSFAKSFYFGLFDSKKVFPFPKVSLEERLRTEKLLDKLKIFAKEKIDPVAIDKQAKIPEEVILGLGNLGILSMTIPKEYGGLGMSQYAYCKVAEFLASRCSSTALFVNAHQSVGLKALLLFGTDEQKRRWLTPLATKHQIAAFSLTEPNAGSDASGIETRAVFDPIKNVYRINGKKQWTTNGSIASLLTVMARTEIDTPRGKEDKITAFLVTPDMKGFEVTAASLEKVGMRGSLTANLAFHDMEVPAENILGPLGGGLKVCLTVLDYGRTTFGATCTGSAKFLKEKAFHHAKTRYQFKRPLASFPLVKEKLALIAAYTYAMEATTYMTAGFVDSGEHDFMLESAMLKVFASDCLWHIVYETMQIYGGKSFFTDQPLERIMRDSRLNMIGEGANEVMRAFIGAVGMRDVGVELKTVVDALKKPWSDYPILIHFFQSLWHRYKESKVIVQSPALQKESKVLEKDIRHFAIAIVRVLARYKEDVVEKQLDLNRIATAAMAIYTSTAVLSKLDNELENEPDLEVGKFYLHHAHTLLKNSLDNLFSKVDEEICQISDLIIAYEH